MAGQDTRRTRRDAKKAELAKLDALYKRESKALERKYDQLIAQAEKSLTQGLPSSAARSYAAASRNPKVLRDPGLTPKLEALDRQHDAEQRSLRASLWMIQGTVKKRLQLKGRGHQFVAGVGLAVVSVPVTLLDKVTTSKSEKAKKALRRIYEQERKKLIGHHYNLMKRDGRL